jgi:threonine/homoserine/homoserine lactone efflux protein
LTIDNSLQAKRCAIRQLTILAPLRSASAARLLRQAKRYAMTELYSRSGKANKNLLFRSLNRTFAGDMSLGLPFQIDMLDCIIKGILIGMLASAPMGPVGILCIQRTLNKGRWYGFVTGIGAAASDIIYALFTGLGMSFVMDFINNAQNKFLLQIFGSLMLLGFGIYSYMSDPMKNAHQSSNKKGSLTHNGVTAFLVTLSNPLIIFLFMATFGSFAFIIPDHPLEMTVGYLSIVIGALLWWFGLTWLVDKIRNKFDVSGIVILNKIIGSIVIVFSLVALVGLVFNLYQLPEW